MDLKVGELRPAVYPAAGAVFRLAIPNMPEFEFKIKESCKLTWWAISGEAAIVGTEELEIIHGHRTGRRTPGWGSQTNV